MGCEVCVGAVITTTSTTSAPSQQYNPGANQCYHSKPQSAVITLYPQDVGVSAQLHADWSNMSDLFPVVRSRR